MTAKDPFNAAARTPEERGQELLHVLNLLYWDPAEKDYAPSEFDKRIQKAVALVKAGASLEERDSEGRTALILAAEFQDTSCVKMLIDAGAKIDEKDDEGATALLLAAYVGNHAGVEALIEAGAKLDEKDLEEGLTALMYAACEGHLAVVEALIKAGASLDEKTRDGITALMIAMEHIPCLEALIAAGASLDEKTTEGKTALMHAEEAVSEDGDEDYVEVVRILKDAAEQRRLCERAAEAAQAQSRHDAIAARQRDLIKRARPVIVKNAMSRRK
jgi:ankyrin repeat protein